MLFQYLFTSVNTNMFYAKCMYDLPLKVVAQIYREDTGVLRLVSVRRRLQTWCEKFFVFLFGFMRGAQLTQRITLNRELKNSLRYAYILRLMETSPYSNSSSKKSDKTILFVLQTIQSQSKPNNICSSRFALAHSR